MNEIPDRDRLLTMDDAELARHCVFEFVKGTGAGGQHRNRVYTAVRVRHVGTGLTATDCTERSQLRNRVNALRKLRLRIAAAGRLAPQPLPRPECALAHADYPLWCARLLDHLEAAGYEPKSAAASLGLSASALVKKLYRDPALWQDVGRRRAERGLPPLLRP